MSRVRLISLMLALCATVAFGAPHSAFAAGPMTTPETLVSEDFESPVAVTYTTAPFTPGAGLYPGYWKSVTSVATPAHSGLKSLWCDGTWTDGLTANPIEYSELSSGYATFAIPQTANYYQPLASLYYSMPSLGDSDGNAFQLKWTATLPGPNEAWATYPTRISKTSANQWVPVKDIDLTTYYTGVQGESLSRAAGKFRLQWKDTIEVEYLDARIHVGQGASVDDLTLSGWMFGPVRSLSATTTSVSTTLTWARPWRSTFATSTEERPIAFRVWRAPKSTTAWTEITSPASRPATTGATYSFKDTTVADGTAYTYAVQAWAANQSSETTGYGQHAAVNATTTPFPLPSVAISSPASGTVVVGTGAATVSGTVNAFDGATVSSMLMQVKREDNWYYSGTTGSWTASPASVTVNRVGSNWSAAWTPTANDYLLHTYTITTTVTDSRGKTASTSVKVKADSVPYVAPVATVTSPTADAIVATTGTITLTGSATVQTGLPTAQVEVSIAHGATWWNGSAWTTSKTWVPASVVGSAWALAGVLPPANEYLTPGYSIQVRAHDAHGLTGTSALRDFTVDSVPRIAPTITLAVPENGTDLLGTGPYTLRGTAAATHPNLPLTGVTLTIARDDGTWWNGSTWVGAETSVDAVGTGTWTYSWVPPVLEYYSHHYTIQASVTDAHGLVTDTAAAVVRVNSTVPNPPDVAVTFPSSSTITSQPPVAISGTASGRDGAIVQNVSVHIGRSTGPTGSPTSWWNGIGWVASETAATYVSVSGYSPGDAAWAYPWPVAQGEYLAHEYTFRAYAHDDRGQVGTSTPVSAQVDSVPFTLPTVSITSPTKNTTDTPRGGGSIAVTGKAATVVASLPLASVRVTVVAERTPLAPQYWNGTGWQTTVTSVTPSGLGTWSTSFKPLAGDDHRYSYKITAKATDAHQLSTTSSAVVVYADTVYPRIVSARSLGRYAIELRFNERVYTGSGEELSQSSARYFSVAGLRLDHGAWSADGMRVRFRTSRQGVVGGSVKVTRLLEMRDWAGNIAPKGGQ